MDFLEFILPVKMDRSLNIQEISHVVCLYWIRNNNKYISLFKKIWITEKYQFAFEEIEEWRQYRF